MNCEDEIMNEFKSWPEGYNRLANKIIPFYMRPMKGMLMKLFIRIIAEG